MLDRFIKRVINSVGRGAGGVFVNPATGEVVDIQSLPAGSVVERDGKRYVVRRRRRRKRTSSKKPEQIPITTWTLWGSEQPSGYSPYADLPAPTNLAEVNAIYKRELEAVLPEIVARLEPLVGAHASGWQLRYMKTRWGSCTIKTGKIRINVRLAAYPRECLEYVVVHELTHLLEPSHNQRFHTLVARVIPNEREIRKILRTEPLK